VSDAKSETSGHTNGECIVMTIGTERTMAGAVLGTLAHEVAHCSGASGTIGHGPVFWERVDALAKRRWGASSGGTFVGGYRRQRAVDLDIQRALAEGRDPIIEDYTPRRWHQNRWMQVHETVEALAKGRTDAAKFTVKQVAEEAGLTPVQVRRAVSPGTVMKFGWGSSRYERGIFWIRQG
jgi:hypothetical protein